MRLMCINQGKWFCKTKGIWHEEGPKYGEICIAIQIIDTPPDRRSYIIEGYETLSFLDIRTTWDSRGFIPLSDDTDEVIKEEPELAVEYQ